MENFKDLIPISFVFAVRDVTLTDAVHDLIEFIKQYFFSSMIKNISI